MPHGRPEEGVKKTGFALVTLKKPLEFNHEDNDPVDILITMAAVDANTHQEVGIMQSSTCLKMRKISTVYVPAVPSRKYWISLTAPTRQLKKELKMSLPMLQVALDNQTMDSAYETTRLIAEEVDIIEVGTSVRGRRRACGSRSESALPAQNRAGRRQNCRCGQNSFSYVLRSQR